MYSVSEISAQIREILEGRFPDLWVEGEVSNFVQAASGHLYFTLKDAGAQIAAVCFRTTARLLRLRPENGKTYRVRGRVSAYEARGQYQLIVDVMEPAGLGALHLAFEQLKEKLSREGLFDAARKRPLPELPRRVGIVTSPGGAALRDVLSVLGRRHDGIDVLIVPCEVQGANASFQIAEAIDRLNQIPGVDVIILTRGGGSIEDLWAFNEERVARAIVRSIRPVISAVGHEVDFTIADFAADLRAPTPSAAAEIVVSSKIEWQQRLVALDQRGVAALRLRLAGFRRFLNTAAGSRGFAVAEGRVRRLTQRADELRTRLDQSVRSGAVFRIRRQQVRLLLEKAQAAARRKLLTDRDRLGRAAHTLDALSPLAVLERGYAICRTADGRVVRRADEVSVGDHVTIRLHRGAAGAVISDIRTEEG